MSDIFISYKREDQSVARRLADALKKKGLSVWWDPKLRAGEHFDDAIEKALNEARCVLVIWSKLSVNSRYVKDEATYALKRKKLVPIAIEKIDLPFRFEGIHTEQLIDWDGSDKFPGYQKLLADIIKILDGPQVKSVEPNRKIVEAEKRQDKYEQFESKAPELKSIATAHTEQRPSEPKCPKPHKASNAVKFGVVTVVILLIMAGTWWYHSENLKKSPDQAYEQLSEQTAKQFKGNALAGSISKGRDNRGVKLMYDGLSLGSNGVVRFSLECVKNWGGQVSGVATVVAYYLDASGEIKEKSDSVSCDVRGGPDGARKKVKAVLRA
jgi:hypothetical protein